MLILIPIPGGRPMHFEFGVPIETEMPEERRMLRMVDTYPAQKDDLWSMPVERAVDILTRIIISPTLDSRRLTTVIECMGRLGYPDHAALVRNFADHPEPMVRRAAIRTLGQLASHDDAAAIQLCLRDPDGGTRKAAILALACLAGRQYIPALNESYVSDVEHAGKATEAIRRIRAAAYADVRPYVDAVLETDEYEDLAPLVPTCWQAVAAVLEDPVRPPQIRARAARLLYLRRVRHARAAFRAVLQEPPLHRDLTLEAIRGCGFCEVREAMEDVFRVGLEGDGELRWTAVGAIGRMGEPAAFEPLLSLWKEADLRLLLRLSLRRIASTPGYQYLSGYIDSGIQPPPAAPAVIHQDLRMIRQLPFLYIVGQLQSPDPGARRDAIALLGAYGDAAYTPHLENVALKDPDERNRTFAQRAVNRLLVRH